MSFTPKTPQHTALVGTSVAADTQASQCAKAPTKLTAAERTAKLLAFRYPTHNFTTMRTPAKPVHFSTGRNATI